MESKTPQVEASNLEATERELDEEQAARRDFLKKAGTAAAAAPVMGLLIAVDAKPAYARGRYGDGSYESLSSHYSSVLQSIESIIQNIITWIRTHWT